MKRKWGNYWLDLIEFERMVQGYIERSVSIFVGKRYSSSLKLKTMMNEAIKDAIDELSQQELMMINVEYKITIDFKDDTLHGFNISHVYCV
jgi:hypothetical protein